MTNAMKLMSEMTHFFNRKESHFTVDGVRALVEFEGYLYCVDVKPVAKVPEAHSDQAIEEQQQAAEDGSC